MADHTTTKHASISIAMSQRNILEQEFIEGIEEVRRKQSAEHGDIREPPDPTNPETPRRQIPLPPPLNRDYLPDIRSPPADECELYQIGYKEDFDDDAVLITTCGNKPDISLAGSLGDKNAAKFTGIHYPMLAALSLCRKSEEEEEADKEVGNLDQHNRRHANPWGGFLLGCDGTGVSNMDDSAVPPSSFIEDNQPRPKGNPDQTASESQVLDSSELFSRPLPYRKRRPNSSTDTEAGSNDSVRSE